MTTFALGGGIVFGGSVKRHVHGVRDMSLKEPAVSLTEWERDASY